MLQEADDFLNTNIIIPLKYNTFTIKKGTMIFRGDYEQKKPISKDLPAFFSDIITATIFTRGHWEYLYGFIVIRQPRLFHLSYKNLYKLKNDKSLSEEEFKALDRYLGPFINPIDFLKPEDAPKLYLNRRILQIICRLGYDGWLAYPDSLKQSLQGRKSFYNPEIALCDWPKFLNQAI